MIVLAPLNGTDRKALVRELAADRLRLLWRAEGGVEANAMSWMRPSANSRTSVAGCA